MKPVAQFLIIMTLVIAVANGRQLTLLCTGVCPEEMVVDWESGVYYDLTVKLCDCYYDKIPECFLSCLGKRWEMACAGGGMPGGDGDRDGDGEEKEGTLPVNSVSEDQRDSDNIKSMQSDPTILGLRDQSFKFDRQGGAIGSVQGDQTIVGLRGQSFKFEGQGGSWYANLSAESLQWNMKFH